MNYKKFNNPVMGSIIGDIVGSIYEFKNDKTKDFDLFKVGSEFTDDTVLTVAVLESYLNGIPYKDNIHKYGNDYPRRGFGKSFIKWLKTDGNEPYNSYGNGSAMRVSSIGYLSSTVLESIKEAELSAIPTHNHIEGIKGAQAISLCIHLAKLNNSKENIKTIISKYFKYDLNFTIDSIRETYEFDVSCQGSVPQAIVSFLDSTSYEDCIRNAISIGGDSDTIACMSGGIASVFYKEIPNFMIKESLERLPIQFIKILEKI